MTYHLPLLCIHQARISMQESNKHYARKELIQDKDGCLLLHKICNNSFRYNDVQCAVSHARTRQEHHLPPPLLVHAGSAASRASAWTEIERVRHIIVDD